MNLETELTETTGQPTVDDIIARYRVSGMADIWNRDVKILIDEIIKLRKGVMK